MKPSDYWREILDELYPDAAPHEEGLKNARHIYAMLYGRTLLAPAAGVGECDDCKRERELLVYGKLEICWRCAFLRRRAAMFPHQEVGS